MREGALAFVQSQRFTLRLTELTCEEIDIIF